MTTIWITKYALSSGIFSVDTEVEGGSRMASYRRTPDHYTSYVHGNDWHLSRDEAVKRAEEMRKKKIESLQKQIKKLSSIDFSVECGK